MKRAQVIELAEKTKLSSQKVVSRHPRTPPPIPRPSVTKHKAIDITILRERAGKTRQVVIDLEMTGSSPQIDRITDIGCVSLVNLQKTGEFFQRYVNPERSVRHEAYRLTGLTQSFLINYRLFSEVADEFLRFIKGADLIFHGSSSDLLFFAKELERAGKNYELEKKHFIIDTYDIAKSLFPEQRHSLDALNSSLNINIPRPKHGALVDAEITADAYIKMLSLEGLKRKD